MREIEVIPATASSPTTKPFGSVVIYEKPTPTGDSRKSIFAALNHNRISSKRYIGLYRTKDPDVNKPSNLPIR